MRATGPAGQLFGAFAACAAAAIWGGMYVVSKYVLDFVPPITLVVARLAIASVVLLAIAGKRGPRIGWRELPSLALCGFIGYTISLVTQFAGTQLATAHDGAVIT